MYRRARRPRRTFERAVERRIQGCRARAERPLTRADTAHLPPLVRRYVHESGALGEPRVRNVRAEMNARMRTTPEDDWIELRMEQYSFFGDPARFLYLHGFPVVGLHEYRTTDGGVTASMQVSFGGLYPITEVDGPEMAQSETVTFLNDMVLLAPGTLVDERISWETVDSNTVEAVFTNGDLEVSARLLFDDDGRLVDFVSDDRYYIPDEQTCKRVRWSTPVDEGALIWRLPDGPFKAADVEVLDVEYNVEAARQPCRS